MRYSLVKYNRQNVEDITGFAKICDIPNLNEESLADIVKFTNTFKDESELWDFLTYSGLIGPQITRDNSLGIAYYAGKNSTPSILPYGLSFREDKKFFNVEFLKSYFTNRVRNVDFMDYFLSKYYDRLKNANLFSYTMQCLNNAFNHYILHHELPQSTIEKMLNFIEDYTYKKDKNGNKVINFTRVRELAMFAISYERLFIRKREPIIKDNSKDINMEISHYETLLNEDNLSLEERTIYENKIKELQIIKKDNIYGRK